MKKSLTGFLPLFLLIIFAFTGINDPLPIGSAIPNADAKLKDVTGKEVSLRGSLKPNGLLVMFSCNTCPVVKKYQSRTLEAAKDATSRQIGVILLNSNEAYRDKGDGFADMQAYAKQQGYDFSYVLDQNSAMADLFGALRTPEVFLFDGKGLLVYHGAIDDNSNAAGDVTRKHLALAMQELVSGKEISTRVTRSVGCSIKRPE
ncbi:MAG: thioredoxin family protein [Chitinophagaceae bacterium]